MQNQQYEGTEMLMSFFQSSKTWDRSSDGLYSSYSDIVFADSVAAKLRDAVGDICIVVSPIRGLKMLPVAESQLRIYMSRMQ